MTDLWQRLQGDIRDIHGLEGLKDQSTDAVDIKISGDRQRDGPVTVKSPVKGRVNSINEELKKSPTLLNQSPHGKGWLFSVTLGDEDNLSGLLTPAQYRQQIFGVDERGWRAQQLSRERGELSGMSSGGGQRGGGGPRGGSDEGFGAGGFGDDPRVAAMMAQQMGRMGQRGF